MIVYVYHWRMVPPCPFGRRTNSLRNPLGLALKHDETPSQGWEDFTWLIGTCHHAHVSDSQGLLEKRLEQLFEMVICIMLYRSRDIATTRPQQPCKSHTDRAKPS